LKLLNLLPTEFKNTKVTTRWYIFIINKSHSLIYKNRKLYGEIKMEIRVLKYFLTVAREENITKAAEILHITQPTLSRQLMQPTTLSIMQQLW
jgi:hypothetical protein